jgi:single-strand DNA-binding protein
MNVVVLRGRLTRDPEVRYTNDNMCVTRYTVACDRRFSKDNEADFIPCIAFGKSGEFAEKYFRKGMSVAVKGRIQTGSYTNKDGQKVYTTDVIIEDQEFAESKTASNGGGGHKKSEDDFMNIPDGIDEELPFT